MDHPAHGISHPEAVNRFGEENVKQRSNTPDLGKVGHDCGYCRDCESNGDNTRALEEMDPWRGGPSCERAVVNCRTNVVTQQCELFPKIQPRAQFLYRFLPSHRVLER